MSTILKLSDNKLETVCDVQDFERLIDTYMGNEAVKYFQELMDKVNKERKELRSTRSYIEDQVLNLISQIELMYEGDREVIAEEFSAIMEDIFGVEEN